MAQNFSLTRRKRPSRSLVADADGGVLERAAEPLLALPQRLLGLPEVGDVGAGPEPFDDLARAVADGDAAGLEPAVHAVRTADAIFHVIGAAPRHRVGPESPGRLPVVRVQRRQPAPAQQVTPRATPVCSRPLRTEVIAGAVGRRATRRAAAAPRSDSANAAHSPAASPRPAFGGSCPGSSPR